MINIKKIDGHNFLTSLFSYDGINEHTNKPIDITNNPATITGDTRMTIKSQMGGYLYIDGTYTGHELPATLHLKPGNYLLSAGVEEGTPAYYRKHITVKEGEKTLEVTFNMSDKVQPRTWKVLWYGVPKVKSDGSLEAHQSLNRLETCKNEFLALIKNIEKKSYGTIVCEVKTVLFDQAMQSIKAKDAYGRIQRMTYYDILKRHIECPLDLEDIDNIFVFCDSQGRPKSSPADGLWTSLDSFIMDCYSVHRGKPKDSEKINYLLKDSMLDIDEVVWLPEWLYVETDENTYDKEAQKNMSPADGSTIFAPPPHKYKEALPEKIEWYFDLIQGKVPNNVVKGVFLGIGPEAFWAGAA